MKVLFLKKYPEYFIADKPYLDKRNTYILRKEFDLLKIRYLLLSIGICGAIPYLVLLANGVNIFPLKYEDGHLIIMFLPFVIALVVLFITIPIHELLHYICMPKGDNYIGFIGIQGGFAHHAGFMSRKRYLLICIFPYVVLSILPLIIFLHFMSNDALLNEIFGCIICFEAFVCVGDFREFYSTLRYVPFGADVINIGEKSYYINPSK